MVATAVHANKSATYLYEKASSGATISDVLDYQQAGELAKNFVTQWATFTGDASDYARRLKVFNPSLFIPAPAGGVSRVLSASVVSVERNKAGRYLITVFLQTQRFGDLNNPDAVPEAYKNPAPQSQTGYMGVQPKQKGWEGSQMTVQVAEAQKDGKLYVLNAPVLVAAAAAPAVEIERDYSSQPSAPVVSALTGFLKVYFSSANPADLVNFVTPESGITPVGGWELKSLDSAFVDVAASPTRAMVNVTVARGDSTIQQQLYLSLKPQNGQVFVSKLSPEPN
ncbi:Conjugative transposon protein TcpC [Pelotomaculum schinkii]|uniref:Conjugative transposon protein TcpC n=1 Tax=Pelotomaculum schinkii TaxID=78350 RepID=A0A4Y7R6W1_9FIRM|nr:conjugal transfer protein [Pelotomaculum schinkii]TEB04688.1 Conjugative transposon protein TcpC [Pelotomaculum schinkii]